MVERTGAKSNALSRDVAAVNYAHPTSNERKVGVIVCEGVHKVVHGALPLYVTRSDVRYLVFAFRYDTKYFANQYREYRYFRYFYLACVRGRI